MANPALMLKDLDLSGLAPEDLDTRVLEAPERAAVNLPSMIEGYVIPYFTLDGKRTGFYRVKAFDHEPKYKQPKNTTNYVYFPQKFLQAVNGHDYVILTEGEKKAAAATKSGFPTAALGGVDSWRSRSLVLPKGSQLLPGGNDGSIIVKLDTSPEIEDGPYAKGFEELVKFLISRDLNVIICYDTDQATLGKGASYNVQRAAALLGYELRALGIPTTRIRQLTLPRRGTERVALDDYLRTYGREAFEALLAEVLQARTAFPQHPNIVEFLNTKLQAPRLDRKQAQYLALAVLADLDAKGKRMRAPTTGQMYYFDNKGRRLIRATMSDNRDKITSEAFGVLLYRRYGLGSPDGRLLDWIGTQFGSEEPIEEVEPHRVLHADRTKNRVYLQINDGQYVAIHSGQSIATLHANGDNGILFESEAVAPLDATDLEAQIKAQSAPNVRLQPWWFNVLSDTRLKNRDDQTVKFVTLLHYISPWLNRWKGTQLPVELVIGESGSGKSTLCTLRLNIVSGETALRNSPSDLRDWHASIANAGGVHVIDNVQLTDKNLRQKMSDEICRVVTEPDPHIEMRKLYTNAELFRVPVETTFVVTAINQPFPNTDLIQRSVFIELDKAVGMELDGDTLKSVAFETEWINKHLNVRGGRIGWVAHHCIVLSKFFQLVEKDWNHRHNAKHRLINFEQALMFMARAFGWDDRWIPDFLVSRTDKNISDNDWAMDGLVTYAAIMRNALGPKISEQEISATEIADWAAATEDFSGCQQIVSARRLGRYLSTHKQLVASMAGIVEATKKNNKMYYRFVKPKV